jgi:hypothetical protein
MQREPLFISVNTTFQLKVWMLMRGLILLLVASGLFFACVIQFREQINGHFLKVIMIAFLGGIFYLLKRFVTEDLEVVVTSDGIRFPKAFTKWGFILDQPESFVWPQIAGFYFQDMHASGETFSPSGFSIFLKDGTYRSIATAPSQELDKFQAHITHLTQTLSAFKQIDMKKVGNAANMKAACGIVAWICVCVFLSFVLARIFDPTAKVTIAVALIFLLPVIGGFLGKAYYDKQLRSLIDMD